MTPSKMSRDSEGKKIQGFEPSNIIAGSTSAIDLSNYVAFRVSGDVTLQYTIDGVLTTESTSLTKGAITVCTNIDSITCATAVNIEVM